MDLKVRIDPSNARWTDDSAENVHVTLTRTDGTLTPDDWIGLGVSDYYTAPTVWVPPVLPATTGYGSGGFGTGPFGGSGNPAAPTVQTVVSELTGDLFIGTDLRPTGRVWVWAKVVDHFGQITVRKDDYAALDFTRVTWPAPPATGFGTGGFGTGPWGGGTVVIPTPVVSNPSYPSTSSYPNLTRYPRAA